MKSLIAATVLFASAVSAADIREGLYEVSVRAELAGQPMTQAPMVVRQCVSQQSVQDLMSQMGGTGACKVSDFQQSGNRAHWNLVCTGQMQVSGTGETQINGDEFTGRMNLTVQMGGDQAVPMVQNFTARRVGECQ
jgi:hypothetical protein